MKNEKHLFYVNIFNLRINPKMLHFIITLKITFFLFISILKYIKTFWNLHFSKSYNMILYINENTLKNINVYNSVDIFILCNFKFKEIIKKERFINFNGFVLDSYHKRN